MQILNNYITHYKRCKFSCKNGVLLGTKKDSAKTILKKYKYLKAKKYGCQLCEVKNNCSRCLKNVKIYGVKYCNYMKQRDINIYKKYLLFLEKQFYYGSIKNSRDFYFINSSYMGENKNECYNR